MSWVDTKREFEQIDVNGTKVKITQEERSFTKKDKTDLLFRILGLAAIISPFLLIYFQQRAEIKRQKNLFEFQVLQDALVELKSISQTSKDEELLDAKQQTFFVSTKTKAALIKDNSTICLLDTLSEIALRQALFVKFVKKLRATEGYVQKLEIIKELSNSDLDTFTQFRHELEMYGREFLLPILPSNFSFYDALQFPNLYPVKKTTIPTNFLVGNLHRSFEPCMEIHRWLNRLHGEIDFKLKGHNSNIGSFRLAFVKSSIEFIESAKWINPDFDSYYEKFKLRVMKTSAYLKD